MLSVVRMLASSRVSIMNSACADVLVPLFGILMLYVTKM